MDEKSTGFNSIVSDQVSKTPLNITDMIGRLPKPQYILFPDNYKLLPNTTEIFELEFAYYESQLLSAKELIARGAYFKKINGDYTNHYKICKGVSPIIWEERSKYTEAYFRDGQFSTGYATHGLFPYRGKFHPQLIKAIMNMMGLRKGETVLDPMCGSGTLNVEASIIGINSIGIDKNPFGVFMSEVKCDALKIGLEEINEKITSEKEICNKITELKTTKKKNIDTCNLSATDELILLSFLDAMGYARRTGKSIEFLFPRVLKRYLNQVRSFLEVVAAIDVTFGNYEIKEGDVRHLDIMDSSIDGIVTSPPYSFAIDYVENDRPQLEYLGYNTDKLKDKMIGLIGKTREAKLNSYLIDMDSVLSEMARVLKNNKYAVIIIGSNDIQTGGVRLEEKIKEMAPHHGLMLVKEILKPIKGIRNTMKDEYVLFFRKEAE